MKKNFLCIVQYLLKSEKGSQTKQNFYITIYCLHIREILLIKQYLIDDKIIVMNASFCLYLGFIKPN